MQFKLGDIIAINSKKAISEAKKKAEMHAERWGKETFKVEYERSCKLIKELQDERYVVVRIDTTQYPLNTYNKYLLVPIREKNKEYSLDKMYDRCGKEKIDDAPFYKTSIYFHVTDSSLYKVIGKFQKGLDK